ncbi:hypothetical protein [Aliiroseovarius lamellibrachiae]|uniref:hypothetical protein n=1 Tax=Aliiroseovarius lamellibrachiae TaxID=1924933 RepID=UPI001BE07A97|nr:hypothetical protein [Aliiroseovarius lamellibrachiae]MBT2131457.1 hypothetical protein [Aliiroseovarius lamellibrachiae]
MTLSAFTCRSFILVLFSITQASCDSPSPQFRSKDTTTAEVTVEGSVFKIHRRENWVESYRTSFEALPNVSKVLGRAKVAIERATGCPIRQGSLSGDQGIQRAELNCDGSLPPVPPSIDVEFSCEIYDRWSHSGGQVTIENAECTPVDRRP